MMIFIVSMTLSFSKTKMPCASLSFGNCRLGVMRRKLYRVPSPSIWYPNENGTDDARSILLRNFSAEWIIMKNGGSLSCPSLLWRHSILDCMRHSLLWFRYYCWPALNFFASWFKNDFAQLVRPSFACFSWLNLPLTNSCTFLRPICWLRRTILSNWSGVQYLKVRFRDAIHPHWLCL